MNNIPENILQQVADAAFAQSPSSPLSCVTNGTNWKRQPNIRRAVIQHAITNPAIAPFLAAADTTPPAQAELAAQVPLEPEDVPPGSVVRCDNDHWFQVLYANKISVCINNVGLPVKHNWVKLQAEGWQINTSIPETGRWDENAWRPCSKPAGK